MLDVRCMTFRSFENYLLSDWRTSYISHRTPDTKYNRDEM